VYESDVSEGVQVTVLFYIKNKLGKYNKWTEIIKITSIFDSVNRTRFPKEDHLPDWVLRDNQVKKGDLLEHVSMFEDQSLMGISALFSTSFFPRIS
jgi:hypothetical protein